MFEHSVWPSCIAFVANQKYIKSQTAALEHGAKQRQQQIDADSIEQLGIEAGFAGIKQIRSTKFGQNGTFDFAPYESMITEEIQRLSESILVLEGHLELHNTQLNMLQQGPTPDLDHFVHHLHCWVELTHAETKYTRLLANFTVEDKPCLDAFTG